MPEAYIDGVGFWSDLLAGWESAAPVLAGSIAHRDLAHGAIGSRPIPRRLNSAERRRVPDTVCLAMAVADEAVGGSGHDPDSLACVFASAHGDLGLTDYLCAQVADDARAISPTRFHNSVHNAPVGYWTMAVGCHRPGTALAAHHQSFSCGLLEALVQCEADRRAILFAAYDMAAPGLLADMNSSRHALAFGLVLAPVAGTASRWVLDWALTDQSMPDPAPEPVRPPFDRLRENALADCLPFCRALAVEAPGTVIMAAGPALTLRLELRRLS